MLEIYLDYCWNVWEKAIESLEKYILYAAKNFLQIRKS